MPSDQLWEHLVSIANNKDRMRCVARSSSNLPIGSDVTESAAKTVVGRRAKNSGQRWSDYANKGILDRGHLRFFTRSSAIRMFHEAGFEVATQRTTPVPWENVLPRALGSFIRDKVEKSDYFLTRLRPNLFAYQHLFELRLPSAR